MPPVAASLPYVDFAPIDFGIPPNVVPATDTAQLLALAVAQQVLEDAAGGDFLQMDRERITVVLGVAGATEMVATCRDACSRRSGNGRFVLPVSPVTNRGIQ